MGTEVGIGVVEDLQLVCKERGWYVGVQCLRASMRRGGLDGNSS